MTIQDLGSVGELIASIATLATLVYLAVQIRQNTASVKSNNFNNMMSGFNLWNTTLLQDPTLVRILYVGLADPEELTIDELRQFTHMMYTIGNIYRNLLYQYEIGALPADKWAIMAPEAKEIFASAGGAYFRKTVPSLEELMSYLDTVGGPSGSAFDRESFTRLTRGG